MQGLVVANDSDTDRAYMLGKTDFFPISTSPTTRSVYISS